MTDKPTPAFRLRCGTVVCGYRLAAYLGRGFESTSYLAAEEHSGVARRLKFYRPADGVDLAYLGHVGGTVSALNATGALPTYHHLGIWQRGRDSVPFLVFAYIEGRPLHELLRAGRWRRGWTDRKAVAALASMACKLAGVHAAGLALGDFKGGCNVLVGADGEATWIDFDPGWPEEPNKDQARDARHWFSILDSLAAHTPASPLIDLVSRKLERFRGRKRWTGGFARMAAILDELAG